LNPNYVKALLRRTRALEQIGDLKTALKDMITVCEGFSNRISFEIAEKSSTRLVSYMSKAIGIK